MQQPFRVLQVVMIMNRGGIETMIMNHYRKIDRTIIQFDFLVHREERGDYDDEIESLGGKIYRLLPIRPWSYIKYFHALDKFFEEHHHYLAVHAHIQDNCGFAFKYARKFGIEKCIAHSHTAPVSTDYKYVFRLFGSHVTKKYTTHRLACGTDAGKYMFENADFTILKNAIDIDNFSFNEAIRRRKREELHLEEKFVIGHVGRFDAAKNQSFLIEILREVLPLCNNIHLLLVGTGSMLNAVKETVRRFGLENNVTFLGVRNDVNQLLQAMDVFVFPSTFEGLPVSVIEAQASGLPCVLSDVIDKEVKITDNVSFLNLKEPIQHWLDEVLKLKTFIRDDVQNQIRNAGYSIDENVQKLCSLYLQ